MWRKPSWRLQRRFTKIYRMAGEFPSCYNIMLQHNVKSGEKYLIIRYASVHNNKQDVLAAIIVI